MTIMRTDKRFCIKAKENIATNKPTKKMHYTYKPILDITDSFWILRCLFFLFVFCLLLKK